MSLQIWEILCTESGDEGWHKGVSTSKPTTCPHNATHAINVNSARSLETVSTSHQFTIGPDGDFATIPEAFNAGATAVYLPAGVYYVSSDVIIPTGGQLIGEALGSVIIVLLNGASIRVDGSGGVKETVGTISITSGASAIVGVGTTFTNLTVGDFILIGTNNFTIAAITDNTNMTISKIYNGATLSGQPYLAHAMVTGVNIQDFQVVGGSDVSIFVRGLRHGSIRNIAMDNGTPNFQMLDCNDVEVATLISSDSVGVGISLSCCISIPLHAVNVFNASSHGMELINGCVDCVVGSSASESNGSYGLYLSGTTHAIKIENAIFKWNKNKGIYGTATVDNIIAEGNDISRNAGSGIDLEGTFNSISDNVIYDTTGVGIHTGAKSKLIGNTMNNCSTKGIEIRAGDDKCRLSGNIIDGCGAIGIDILGEFCGLTNNGVYDSGTIGIQSGAKKCNYTGNTVTGSGTKGIYNLAAGDKCRFIGNCVDSSAGNGFEIETGATGCVLTANDFTDNTGTNYVDNGTSTVSTDNSV